MLAFCAILAVLLASCSVLRRGPPRYAARPGPYDVLAQEDRAVVVRARRLLDQKESDAARDLLRRLSSEQPGNIPVGRLLQEVELECGTLPEELLLRARARSESAPSPAALLLAARLESDAALGLEQVERALSLDPLCAWAHYARAHLDARSGRWDAAQASVARALEIDPGHLPSRRLETSLLARNGRRPDAILALLRWLAAAGDDPFVSPSEAALAQLDLAQLLLLEGEHERAFELLSEFDDTPGGASRRQCLLAAAEQALGRPRRALDAALLAASEDPGNSLPLVQQALLFEEWLADPAAAREAWRRVLEQARQSGELGGLILSMRARVALERSERARGEGPEEGTDLSPASGAPESRDPR